MKRQKNPNRILLLVPLALVLFGLLVGTTCNKKANRTPDAPLISGPPHEGKDSPAEFSAFVSDPDGDSVSARFAWGDGDTSDWSPWFASDARTLVSHTWTEPDTYEIRAQSRDRDSALSDWSWPRKIRITHGWSRGIGGDAGEAAHCLAPTSDGGFVLAGWTESYSAGSYDAWLVKTDAVGTVTWDQTYGGTEWDAAYSVWQTTDGGFVLAGRTYTYAVGQSDAWLIRTDGTGNQLWHKPFGGALHDRTYEVQQTSDGGYILAGYTESKGAGGRDLWLIKTDASGTAQWDKTFGGTDDEVGHAVRETPDGGYIVAGYTESYGAGPRDAWLIKTDGSGNRIWHKYYGGDRFDHARCVRNTSDGGYIVAGYTESYGSGGKNCWLIKTNDQGDKTWDKTYGGSQDDEIYQAMESADGGYLIYGYTASSGAGGRDAWLIKTGPTGTALWSMVFGGEEYDEALSGVETPGGEVYLAGTTSSLPSESQDAWLIKADTLDMNGKN